MAERTKLSQRRSDGRRREIGIPSRIWCAALLAGSGCLLTGCVSVVTGSAVKAPPPAGSDDAVVALLDTGNYPTTPRPALGRAGSTASGLILESNRMAEFVVGPWEVDSRLRFRDPFRTAPMNSPGYISMYLNFMSGGHNGDFGAIAEAHGYITGFSTARNPQDYSMADYLTGTWQGLTNEVMRFPDADSAAAAAAEMARAGNPPPLGYSDAHPVPIDDHPEASATALNGTSTESAAVASFTAHGPYVLFQPARVSKAEDPLYTPEYRARDLVSVTLNDQERIIDRFAPTDPAKLADLPEDPSGWLAARTLFPVDSRDSPAGMGVWQPDVWLHFSDDPLESATLFRAAGADLVSQALTTVYRAHDPLGAAKVVDRLEANTRSLPGVAGGTPVSGLPAARCFERIRGAVPDTALLPIQQLWWHYKCIAQADRYAFTAFSARETDAKQQIAAQYRILAGK